MVARRMRRRFLGAKRPTNAAMTTSAAPRMRMVEGEAYPSHCRARGLGAGRANGSCGSICCETITAPAPAATAAAALVCSCWSCAARCCDAAAGEEDCAAALPCCGAARDGEESAASSAKHAKMVCLWNITLEGIDVVQLADLQVVATKRGDLPLHLVDDAGLEVVQVDAGAAPVELLQLADHGPRGQVPGDVRQPLQMAGERDLQEQRFEIRRGVQGPPQLV